MQCSLYDNQNYFYDNMRNSRRAQKQSCVRKYSEYLNIFHSLRYKNIPIFCISLDIHYLISYIFPYLRADVCIKYKYFYDKNLNHTFFELKPNINYKKFELYGSWIKK